MSSRYSLIRTDSPRPTYLVIDHAYDDDEPALHPATPHGGAPVPGPAALSASSPRPPPPTVRRAGDGRGPGTGWAVGLSRGLSGSLPGPPPAGPLRDGRRPRAERAPSPGAPSGRPVSLVDGPAPAPRYLHLGTGALGRLRGLHGISYPRGLAWRAEGPCKPL